MKTNTQIQGENAAATALPRHEEVQQPTKAKATMTPPEKSRSNPETTPLSFADLSELPTKRAALFIAAYLRIFMDLLSEKGKDYMPPQQMQILLYVYTSDEDGVPQTQIAEQVSGAKQSIWRNTQKLGDGEQPSDPKLPKGLKLLESYQDPKNRSVNIVRMTPKGRALLDQIHGRAYLALKRLL